MTITFEINVADAISIDASASSAATAIATATTAGASVTIYLQYTHQRRFSPLNFYGESKQMAEKAVHAANPDAIIMRIPILYGPTKDFKESAVSELILGVEKGSPVEMDNICVRYPTCTIDIARVLADVAKLYISKGWPGIRGEDTQLPTTLHFSAQEAFTKYKMSLIFAELLGIKNDHLKPVNESDESAKDSTVQRPKDCHLDISDLKNLGINCGTVNFKEWFRSVLCPRLR